MVSILPGNQRSPWDVIGSQIGSNLHQTLPGAVQQGYQRQLGLNALDEAQKAIGTSGGDPYQIALAFAKAGAQNPALERSLGPLLQTAMQMGRAKNVYGQEGQGNIPPTSNQQTPSQQQNINQSANVPEPQEQNLKKPYPSELKKPPP